MKGQQGFWAELDLCRLDCSLGDAASSGSNRRADPGAPAATRKTSNERSQDGSASYLFCRTFPAPLRLFGPLVGVQSDRCAR